MINFNFQSRYPLHYSLETAVVTLTQTSSVYGFSALTGLQDCKACPILQLAAFKGAG